jgi:predicted regulator of Ras-like GTPase activity (Roadblock/LC7/MglB family)
MDRSQQLNDALNNLMAASADIEACAAVTEDGLIIASALPQGMDEDHVAAISSVMISMGVRICTELDKKELEQLFVKGKDGYIIMSHAGPHAVLVAMTRKEAKLGLIFLDMSRATDTLAEILD